MNFDVNKNDCIKVDNFFKEIKMNRTKPTEYWETNYNLFYNKNNSFCNKFIYNSFSLFV